MSISTDEFRARLDRELDLLGPGPDLVPAATARGVVRVRRRRAMAGAALAMVAVAGGVLATGVVGGGAEPGGDRGHAPIANDPSPPTTEPGPLDDGHVTASEWNETVRSTLAQVLPARYGAVTMLPTEPGRVDLFATAGGLPQIQARIGVFGWLKEEDPSRRFVEQGCAAINQARELHDCAQASFGDGWFAVATVDLLPPGNRGFAEGERIELPSHDPANPPEEWSYGTALTIMNDGIRAELNVSELGWDEVEDNGPAGISVEELVALAQEPAFLEMLRVGAQWWYDRPATAPIVDPDSGREIPSLTGDDQVRPPYVR
ncbi:MULTISPECIES: hypothetical protein [unclassified Nocardioides]|uniref:hypothetical protein n=1 Tax=unclassified Nocardioides TaxID=2615069 RepID=UPI000701AEA0|nr:MULTISPECIES: hypothetical protein [unclassified Nocardioides]KRA38701.1 hypothetical protein ASD81_08880 [Nocardioides sp. Root614]KRA92661.1 hypothetical protein ASD84_09145 [Nocardioides sp. Root682]